MELDVYIESVSRSLARREGVIEDYSVTRLISERGLVVVKLVFSDESVLDMRETIDCEECFPNIIAYSYYYLKDNDLIFGYDNVSHHPELSATFPYHKHVKSGERIDVVESDRPTHASLFAEILDQLPDISHLN